MGEWITRIYRSRWTELLLRWFIGAMFMFAAVHKIADPARFASAVNSYDLFPGFSINLIAVILPYLEVLSGLALVVGLYIRGAAVLVCGMLSVFIVALAVNLMRAHPFDCGCFSFGTTYGTTAALALLVRDIVFLAFSLYILRFRGDRIGCLQHAGCGFRVDINTTS